MRKGPDRRLARLLGTFSVASGFRTLTAAGLYNFGGKLAQVLGAVVLAALFVRFCGLQLYGSWTLIQAIVGSAAVLDLGMSSYVEWSVASRREGAGQARHALRSALTMSLAVTGLLAVLAILLHTRLAPLLARYFIGATPGLLLLLLCLGYLVTMQSQILSAVLSGDRRFGPLNANRTFTVVARTVLLCGAIASGTRSLTTLLALSILSTAASLVLLIPTVRSVLGPPDVASSEGGHRIPIRFVGGIQATNAVLVLGDQLFRALVAARFGLAAAGLFDLCQRVAVLPRTMASLISATTISYVAHQARAGRDGLGQIRGWSLLWSAVLVVPATSILLFGALGLQRLELPSVPRGAALVGAELLVMHLMAAVMAVDAMLARGLARPEGELFASLVPYAIVCAILAFYPGPLTLSGGIVCYAGPALLCSAAYVLYARRTFHVGLPDEVRSEIRRLVVAFVMPLGILCAIVATMAAPFSVRGLLLGTALFVPSILWLWSRLPGYAGIRAPGNA